MLTLLERSIATLEHRLVLLAPAQATTLGFFRHVEVDEHHHRDLVGEMQRMRGAVYLRDGALEPGQLSDGRHQTPEDERSWHLLMLNRERRVSACVWYMEHENTTPIRRLRARTCALARMQEWRDVFHRAVESELARARRDRLQYAEVGGWAVAPENRCTSEGLLLALAAYSLGRMAGGALGLTTATVRHCSSTILRRIGGRRLEADGVVVPPYFDPRYKCEMELLRFDSRRPSAKYASMIDRLGEKLASVHVIAASEPAAAETSRSRSIPASALSAA